MQENHNTLKLKFIGAAQEVTGSKTLVSYMNGRYLIDCGLFQGGRELRHLNWQSLPNTQNIDSVILTHAHLDHSGYLPKLVRDGFEGKIYCTQATATLVKVLLADAAKLEEEDAKYANRTGHSSHRPALPLFTMDDVERVYSLLTPVVRDEWFELSRGLTFRFIRSGHLLGSSFVQLSFNNGKENKLVTFSGDLGSERSNVIKGPAFIQESDYLVLESTYGDKTHKSENLEEKFAKLIRKVHDRRGVLVIPAFAVGRTQEVLFLINKLESEKKIPKLPLYIDSPMALSATQIYETLDEDLKLVEVGNKLKSSMDNNRYTSVDTVEKSMKLNRMPGPAIIISASGMITGGRIIHHLKNRLPGHLNAVLFIGFQPEGTKGRLLQNGIDRIRLHHQEVEVKAKIVTMSGMSAHADSKETIQWLKHFKAPPAKVFLNHGEILPLKALSYRIRHELGWDCVIPNVGEEFSLN